MARVLTFGVFDFFHIGHLKLFQKCREYGDHLIVGVQRDEYVARFKPDYELFYSVGDRMEMVGALRIVDEVFAYDTLCAATMEMKDFDILALGQNHRGERFDVIVRWCEEHGRSVIRLDRTPGISSTMIKSAVMEYIHE